HYDITVQLLQAIHLLDPLCVYHLAVRLEHPHGAAVLERLETHAIGFLGLRVEQRHVRDVDRHVLVDDAALQPLHRVRPDVLLDAVDALNHDVFLVDATQHGATLALVTASDHHHIVALANRLHRALRTALP